MENFIHKKLIAEIFYTALQAVDPYESVKLHTDKIRSVYQGGNFKRLIVIGFGKAASMMAKAMCFISDRFYRP